MSRENSSLPKTRPLAPTVIINGTGMLLELINSDTMLFFRFNHVVDKGRVFGNELFSLDIGLLCKVRFDRPSTSLHWLCLETGSQPAPRGGCRVRFRRPATTLLELEKMVALCTIAIFIHARHDGLSIICRNVFDCVQSSGF